ncbi:large subunit ribosomal protein L7Ae [Vigna unguiculata]|uniref:RING-type E3 ubiquitin transferase n=1 Tax=Vigna unguiculata TaxID=3917 RepID=A0A4D6NLH2_VIGUN|nr:large subunit ribosomal protein L7Ae [Vigna unguiculata]
MTSTASLDNSLSDMYRSPPRPLPYDSDPRFFHSQRDGLVSRREKGSSHLNEESEPLRGDVDADSESLNLGGKWNDTSEDGSKEYRKSSVRLSSAKLTTGAGVVYSSSEVEDVCPTCLEEYTEENPKIVTKCSHHFHLGCIYEWMERSDNCPVCGKVKNQAEPVSSTRNLQIDNVSGLVMCKLYGSRVQNVFNQPVPQQTVKQVQFFPFK